MPPGAEAPLLRNISFALQPGEVLGIIGPSGAGKSTLAHLLVGAWRPQRGTIRLDGAALEQWDDDELGRHLGFLPQYPSLFSGSCRREHRPHGGSRTPRASWPRPSSPARTRRSCACRAATTPVVGPQGQRLSGGEQQRIALARALYGEPGAGRPRRAGRACRRRPRRSSSSARSSTLRGAERTVVLITHHLAQPAGGRPAPAAARRRGRGVRAARRGAGAS